MKLIDLSQPWNIHTPGFPTYDGPVAQWIKRLIIAAFPWKFVGGEVAMCRVVAFVED